MVTVSQAKDRSKSAQGSASSGAMVIRGQVPAAPDDSVSGSSAVGERGGMKVREHPLHAGAVFGMTDMMLGLPLRATYTTTSFVHLVFFDKMCVSAGRASVFIVV